MTLPGTQMSGHFVAAGTVSNLEIVRKTKQSFVNNKKKKKKKKKDKNSTMSLFPSSNE